MLICEYRGLKVAEMDALREQLYNLGKSAKSEDYKFEVVKNNLFALALEKTSMKGILGDLELKGPIAVLWSKDVIDVSKVVVGFSKEHQNLKLKFALCDGKLVTDKQVVAISKLPSKEVLISKFMGVINSPLAGLITILSAPLRNLLVVLSQKAKK